MNDNRLFLKTLISYFTAHIVNISLPDSNHTITGHILIGSTVEPTLNFLDNIESMKFNYKNYSVKFHNILFSQYNEEIDRYEYVVKFVIYPWFNIRPSFLIR